MKSRQTGASERVFEHLSNKVCVYSHMLHVKRRKNLRLLNQSNSRPALCQLTALKKQLLSVSRARPKLYQIFPLLKRGRVQNSIRMVRTQARNLNNKALFH